MPSPLRLPLHTLPAFRVVARLANLRAAAEELHLTHSAVSQQIKLLESQIGFALFDRRGRRVVLNAAGAALLRAVEPALAQLDDGLRAAAAASGDESQRIRITLLNSFAQRWLLPRMGRWRERHPDIGIELHTSQNVIDLQREGFHAALRQGSGQWRGLESVCLTDSPLIVVGSPEAAHRLSGRDAAALADEPLLGSPTLWQHWFALSGVRTRVNPVAAFNDAGLMLQAAEQNLGLALAREILAADALREGRLVRLSPIELQEEQAYAYWLAFPEGLRAWPPLLALRDWLLDELARSQRGLDETKVRGTAPAGRSGNRSRAVSATRARRRA
ncbi:MAG: LysR substrate-binding domain-containing protein [Aquincola sp.]|nr:LysR substrate-binding domain-containing protein [Aquincola sp.]MDH5328586.1 LysR substrate-binding domain-containing protein [Aquincola sp.]